MSEPAVDAFVRAREIAVVRLRADVARQISITRTEFMGLALLAFIQDQNHIL
ncbi:hypothetical protein [Aestuariivirga sp.]|uniref:hypothetical protein n=1 Tax=Aestuariivirga sp. TaxID=2650926 RepID=UPI003593AF93